MKRKLMLLLACMFIGIGVVTAQTQKVTGVVISDEDGHPVVGASVLVKGTTIGAITDLDGEFTLSNVPATAKHLVVSYIGMMTQEVSIKPVLKIVLKSDAELLDEVVVTAYGTSTKGAFTGSASTMKAATIEKRQVANVSNALAGAVAGVQIQSSNGQPGSTATVRVRGVGSINAGSNPLYVVDGIPFDGDLASINTQDIETMTVLKDAASTALYGARGANGIIMITTKKGTQGKARITFDTKLGANSRSVKNYDVMSDKAAYMENVYSALYSAGINQLKKSAADANLYANSQINKNSAGGLGYKMYTVPTGESLFGMDGRLNPNATLGYNDGTYYYTPDDWAGEMFESKLRQEYNLTVAGGNDKATYYVSMGLLDDSGIIEGSGFTRYSGRFKGEYKVTEWLKIGANVNYNYAKSNYPGEQTNTASSGNAFYIANMIAPIYPLYVRNASGQIMTNQNRKVYDYGDGESTNFSRSFMSISNPAGDLIYDKTDYLMDIFNSTWYAELNPLKGLTITARWGLNIDNTRYNNLGNTYMGQSASYGGTAYQSHTRTSGLNQQYIANYQFQVGEDNYFDITAGYDGYSMKETNLFASGQNLYNPESYYVSNAIDNIRGGGSAIDYTTIGYLARLNYSYKDTYYANVSFRRDASSRFHKDERWGNFWSGSAAWILSKEGFLQDQEWINLLKLKASFGQQGNDNVGNYYAWQDQWRVTGADGVFSDGTLIFKGNPKLHWETSTTYNVGVDFNLFANKLNGSIEYFGRKSGDMLYYKPTPGSIGYTKLPVNVGSMINRGLEIDLNWNVIQSNKFNWTITANATMIKNKITELAPELEGELIDGTRIFSEGKSMYRMWLVDWAGVNPENGVAQYWAKNADGELYKTENYSAAQSTHRVATDNLMPKVYGGFGMNFDFYGFDASFQCSYQLGGKIYDSGYAAFMHNGSSSYAGRNWHKDISNAWTPDNPNSNIPRLNSQDQYANSTSTRFITKSNYLSLNNITVGYTLPTQLVRKAMIDRVRLFFAAENVALLSSRKGLDPRQSYTSATTALYTPIRTLSGGLNVTF